MKINPDFEHFRLICQDERNHPAQQPCLRSLAFRLRLRSNMFDYRLRNRGSFARRAAVRVL